MSVNSNLMGKRFLLGALTILCGSAVTVILKFTAGEYIQLIAIVYGSFTISQSYTDAQKIKNQNGAVVP